MKVANNRYAPDRIDVDTMRGLCSMLSKAANRMESSLRKHGNIHIEDIGEVFILGGGISSEVGLHNVTEAMDKCIDAKYSGGRETLFEKAKRLCSR